MSTSFDGSAAELDATADDPLHSDADEPVESDTGTASAVDAPGTFDASSSSQGTWGLRFERSRCGRIVISVFIVILVGSLLVINAPASATKRGLMTVAAPVLSALGMEQGWGVFAPNPRGFSLEVEAHIQQVDGTQRVVPIESGRGLDEYWTYRWQRWADRLATGPDNNAMWDPFCRYLADEDRAAGGKPVRVALVNRRSDTKPPGDGPPRAQPVYREFFAIGVAP